MPDTFTLNGQPVAPTTVTTVQGGASTVVTGLDTNLNPVTVTYDNATNNPVFSKTTNTDGSVVQQAFDPTTNTLQAIQTIDQNGVTSTTTYKGSNPDLVVTKDSQGNIISTTQALGTGEQATLAKSGTLAAVPVRKNTDRLPVPGHPGQFLPVHPSTGIGRLRHFTFILKDQASIATLDLNVNPEGLSIDSPFKVAAVNTMGGGFVDVWGQGIRRVTLRGHTGWRPAQQSTNQFQDGFDNVFGLRDDILNKYLSKRTEYSKTLSQTTIEEQLVLILVDRLHETAYRVVPESFRLLREKRNPLLHMYELSLIILGDAQSDAQRNVDLKPLEDKKGALAGAFGKLGGRFKDLENTVLGQFKGDGSFKNALSDITHLGGGLSGTMQGLMKAKADFTTGVFSITSAARNAIGAIHQGLGVIQSFTSLSELDVEAKRIFTDVKGAVGDLTCLLHEFTNAGLLSYTGVTGSSSCAGLLGVPSSVLQDSPNSFSDLKQSNTNAAATAARTVSGAATVQANKIQQIDGPARLIGRG